MKDKTLSVRVAPLALLLGISLVSGCNGTSSPAPSATPTASPTASPKTVEVGGVTDNTNGTGFRTLLASGDTVTYATLGQGGRHIWGAIKVRNPIKPAGINVAFKITKVSDGTVLFNNADSTGVGPLMTLQADGDGFSNVANGNTGIVGLLCSGTTQCQTTINALLNQKLTLSMSVKDSTGATGTDTATVTLTGQPL